MPRISAFGIAFTVSTIALLPCAEARADDLFFQGKQIKILAQDAASGYSLYAQLISQHLGRFLPGKPSAIVSYMPGAAGLTLSNYMYEVAPRDGTVMAVPDQDLATKQARNLKGVRYDVRNFAFVGRGSSNVPVHMVLASSGVTRLDDLKSKMLVTGAVGMEGVHIDLPRAQNKVLGTKWKIIPGYPSNNQVRIAMERGELSAGVAPATLFYEQLKPWIADRKVNIVTQYADFRHPLFPDVPSIVELVETPEQKTLFKFLVSISTLGRSLVAPPGVPMDRLATLRSAFAAMVRDPQFVADASKVGADVMPMDPDELGRYLNAIAATPPQMIEQIEKLIAEL